MRILAIDPGTNESAYIAWNSELRKIERFGIEMNEKLLSMLGFNELSSESVFDVTAVEMVACYGMAVGKEVFETCVWIGRFHERLLPYPRLVYRRDVKLHHCQSARAKDANVRQALIDKYGPPGTKKEKGVTYGLKSHLWQAFAIATYISEISASFKPEDPARTAVISGGPSPSAENIVSSLTS